MARWRRSTLLVLLAALLLLAPAPTAVGVGGVATPSRAQAWVARISLPGQDVVELASTVAEGGAAPFATSLPAAVAGQGAARASASPDQRDAVATPMSWDDPSGSGHIEGAFADARVSGDTASARAGATTVTGSGFAVANQVLTWDQQKQLMDQWTATNHAVFDPLNEQLAALAPALATVGLRLAPLEPMQGLGWIDVLNADAFASRAEASSSSSFSSARATAEAATIQLFGGFIEIDDVKVDAVSESAGGTDERTASSTIGGLTIAGLDVAVTGAGFELGPNELLGVLPAEVGRDVLAQVLAALDAAGIRLRPGGTRAEADLREASALEIELSTAQGTALVSIGHAEASAPSVTGAELAPLSPPRAPVASRPIGSAVTTAGPERVSLPAVEVTDVARPSSASVPGPQAYALPLEPALGRSTARALETVYLLLTAGMLTAALAIPVVVSSRRPGRRRPFGPYVLSPSAGKDV